MQNVFAEAFPEQTQDLQRINQAAPYQQAAALEPSSLLGSLLNLASRAPRPVNRDPDASFLTDLVLPRFYSPCQNEPDQFTVRVTASIDPDDRT